MHEHLLINLLVMWIPFSKLRRRARSFLYYHFQDFLITKKVKAAFLGDMHIFKKSPTDFSFKECENPTVSIIIPCYNQYEYTRNCLWSILQNTKDVDYEIIIADDCSTDETKNITDHIKNITVARTPSNMRFLKNCNNAAKQAQGKYVLFLNNDTQVMPNWLKPLVDLIEGDKTIGMVGSMLLYPDFTLQEAGGIIFHDASGRNYGRGSRTPWAGEYNYVKDVDYISGASIMLSRANWEKLGGFDELFAPAYYEDTDLAFQIRNNLNLRVVYQPLSRVIHFEGKTNGTDLKSGQKQYQVVNAEKFRKKWDAVLARDHCTRYNTFYARDRSRNKKCLLFIDQIYLTFDKDCGSRASFQYLEFFQKQGFNVKFLAASRKVHDYHKTAIEQMGVECVCCDGIFDRDLEKWFIENGRYVDYIYLNRPTVAKRCFPLLEKHTNAKIIFQGHDLHHLRKMREYKTNPDEKLLKEVKSLEKTEREMLPQMDVVLYFSDTEIEKIKEMNLCIREMDTVPLYLFNQESDAKYIANDRRDIMFIGGYKHTPNQDAAKWLLNEIMPRVWAKKPDIKIHMVGSNMPKALADLAATYPNVVLDGFVTDEQLNTLYRQIKMSVIPLRFGAGIKGKIVEAIYNKVPVITTTIGAEGITSDQDFLTVFDDTEKLADAIIEMYDDNDRLQKISDASPAFIKKHFSENTVLEKFKKWIDIK
ncbi:MAG: glycosyltransferase [Alphaproteobacteria bacterium]|nr:glycosyltransferase [Alphaproteobacteria bacterium]